MVTKECISCGAIQPAFCRCECVQCKTRLVETGTFRRVRIARDGQIEPYHLPKCFTSNTGQDQENNNRQWYEDWQLRMKSYLRTQRENEAIPRSLHMHYSFYSE